MDVTRSFGVTMRILAKIACSFLLLTLQLQPAISGANNTQNQVIPQQEQIAPFYSRWFNAVYESVVAPIQKGFKSLFNNIQSTFFASDTKDKFIEKTTQIQTAKANIEKFSPTKPSQPLKNIELQPIPIRKELTPQPAPIFTPESTPTQQPEPATPLTTDVKKPEVERMVNLAAIKSALKNFIPSLTSSTAAQEAQQLLTYIAQKMDPILSTQMKLGARHIANTTGHITLLFDLTQATIDTGEYKEGEREQLHKDYIELQNNFLTNQPISIQNVTQRITEQSNALIAGLQNPNNLLGTNIYTIFKEYDAYIDSLYALFELIQNKQENRTLTQNSLMQAFSTLHNIITLFPIKFSVPEKNSESYYESFITKIKNSLASKATETALNTHAFTKAYTAFTPRPKEEPVDFDNNFCLLAIQEYIHSHFLDKAKPLVKKFAEYAPHMQIQRQQKPFVWLSADQKTQDLQLQVRKQNLQLALADQKSTYQRTMSRNKAEDFITYLLAFYSPLQEMNIDQKNYLQATILFDLTETLAKYIDVINSNVTTQIFTQISNLFTNVQIAVGEMKIKLENAQNQINAAVQAEIKQKNIQLIDTLSTPLTSKGYQSAKEIDIYLELCDTYSDVAKQAALIVQSNTQYGYALYQTTMQLISQWSQKYNTLQNNNTQTSNHPKSMLDALAQYIKNKIEHLLEYFTDLDFITAHEYQNTLSNLEEFPAEYEEFFDIEEPSEDFSEDPDFS